MPTPPRKLPSIFGERVVVFDGAMGSLLVDRGVSHHHPFEELNLSAPHLVCQVHADYIRAGADVIETNTFGANRYKLANHGLEARIGEIVRSGARLARSVAGDNVLVAGSVGSLGVRLAPLGPASEAEVREASAEVVRALAEGGVDLILLETQTDLDLACVMLDAAFEASDLPVLCQFAVGADISTASGDTVDDIATRLAAYPVSAIGFNCSVGPEQTLRAVQSLREVTDLPIMAQPNSGYPTQVGGRTLFLSGPTYFAERGAEMVQAGAGMVGGCCGTTPAHIQALANAVKGLPRPASAKIREPGPRKLAATTGSAQRSPLLRRMNGGFVTVEMTPPKDAGYHELIEKLRPLAAAGISAIDVTDNPMARMHMSAVAFAHLVKEELGIATILHLTCRDLNLLGMHSTLLGAAALGVDGILALTGDPANVGDYPAATSVFDVTSDGLAKIISSLNAGLDYSGKEIGRATSFAIGGAFNPLADDLDEEIARIERKREAGVNFLMTQPVFDFDALRAAVAKLPEGWDPPILVGILPLRSQRHAEFLHNEVPGISIPEPIRQTLASLDPEGARAEGVRIARELYREARKDFGGVYFMPPFGNVEVVMEVIKPT
jgi:methionine synthase I (cobalamin-dependent)/5,10-methylenetetrahydrofolate reductase